MLDIDLDELFNFSNIPDETDEDEPSPKSKELTVPKYIRKIAEGVHPRAGKRKVKCWTIYAMCDGSKVVMHDDHLDLQWRLC